MCLQDRVAIERPPCHKVQNDMRVVAGESFNGRLTLLARAEVIE
jgi:hypothetical protein